MTFDARKIGRKILAIIVAIICYYIIHEGAHLVFALCTKTFEKIIFMFPGVQIQANIQLMTNVQLGIFNLLGAISTLATAYILYFLRNKISKIKSNALRAVFYYITILFLLNDPVYLSVLYDFFGGRDMNGIKLLMPELIAQILFGIIGLINLIVIFKSIVPTYKKAFVLHNNKKI